MVEGCESRGRLRLPAEPGCGEDGAWWSGGSGCVQQGRRGEPRGQHFGPMWRERQFEACRSTFMMWRAWEQATRSRYGIRSDARVGQRSHDRIQADSDGAVMTTTSQRQRLEREEALASVEPVSGAWSVAICSRDWRKWREASQQAAPDDGATTTRRGAWRGLKHRRHQPPLVYYYAPSSEQTVSHIGTLRHRPPRKCPTTCDTHHSTMSEARLDQIVKGAPQPNAKLPADPPPLPHVPTHPSEKEASSADIADPLSTLPSSPGQIYLNLLILEASFRAQHLTLRARRRLHTFFTIILSLWTAFFGYLLFLKPREDGMGVGGSVYWVVEMAEKLAFITSVVAWLLLWATGQWERGVRWPRRWLHTANRGLRGNNIKIVIIKGPWWKELLSHLSFIFPYSSFFPSPGSSYHYIEHIQTRPGTGRHHLPDEEAGLEEDLAPGGDHIKLLLLPKFFSPEFRENWEEYRNDYWETENERRAILRQRLKQHDRHLARQEGGWLWWTGYRGWKRPFSFSSEKPHHLHHQGTTTHRHHGVDKSHQRRSLIRTDSSRTSSRSTTPAGELDEKPLSERARRGSGSASTKKKIKLKDSAGRVLPLTKSDGTSSRPGSRPTTPNLDGTAPVLKRNSGSFP